MHTFSINKIRKDRNDAKRFRIAKIRGEKTKKLPTALNSNQSLHKPKQYSAKIIRKQQWKMTDKKRYDTQNPRRFRPINFN